MNLPTYEKIEQESVSNAFAGITQKAAEAVIRRQMENMRAQGEVFVLSEEEERLLASFRRFRASCKPGGVFKWQTRPVTPADPLIVEPAAAMLIHDPQDVS